MQANLDYIFFLYGLSFLILAVISFRFFREKIKTSLQWKWMALFGVLHGVHEWANLIAVSFPLCRLGNAFSFLLLTASFICLLEFGRRSFKRNTGQHLVGSWIYGPLVLLCVVCGLHGTTGWEVGVRYSLGFFGSLLTALAFFRRSENTPFHHKKRLRTIGCLFVVYGVAVGLVVPYQDFFPASIINQGSFFQMIGVAPEAVRASCAIVIALLCFSIITSLEILWAEEEKQKTIKRIFIFQLAVLFLVIVGGWIFLQRASEGEVARKSQHLLDRTHYLSQAINIDHLRKLSGTRADLDLAVFERVWDFLKEIPKVFPEQRFAYFLIKKDQQLVFLADSEPLGSQDRSLPGDVFDGAPQAFYDVFTTRQSSIVGPYSDEWGTWISSALPILDPATGQITALFCLDHNAKDWARDLARHRLSIILGILCLSFFIVLSFYIFGREKPLSSKIFYVETFYGAGFSFAVVIFIFFVTLQISRQQRDFQFQRIAVVSQEIFASTFREARHYLETLTKYFECSSDVTSEEFHRYASGLVQDHAGIQAFAWIPIVRSEELSGYEAKARERGEKDFFVFERTQAGGKIPVGKREEYFPLYYLEPLFDNKAALGFDAYSEPIRRQTLERARKKDLRFATGVIDFVVDQKGRKQGILVYQPVYVPKQGLDGEIKIEKEFKGFLMMALRPQSLLETRYFVKLLSDRQLTQSYVIDLGDPSGITAMASYPEKKGLSSAEAQDLLRKKPNELKEIMVFSFFGRSYAVVVTPEKIFFQKYAKPLPWFALFAGFLFSGLLALLIYTLQNQRKRAEDIVIHRTAELFESEQRFRSIFDNMADGVAIYRAVDDGKDFVFVDINRAGQKSSKVDRSDVVGRRITDVFPFVSDMGLLAVMRQVYRTGTSQQHPQTLYKDERLQQWVENFVCKLSSDLIAAVYTDLTELKQQECKALEAHQRLQAIMDSAKRVSIISVNLDGVIQTFNKGAEEMMGYSAKEMIGRKAIPSLHVESEILSYAQELSQEFGYPVDPSEAFNVRIKRGQKEEREWTCVRKDGTRLIVNLVITPLKMADGQIAGYLGTATDVTESKKAREELAEANHSLRENEKLLRRLLVDLEERNEQLKKTQAQLVQSEKMVAVGQLSAGLAHEIKNPLAIMLLAVESLEKKTDMFSEEIQKKFAMIRDSVHRMNKIIKGLLSFSHISESAFSRVSVNHVVSAAVALVQNTAKINNIALRVHLCQDQQIMADTLMLEQVFVNILNNAIDAVQGSGEIFISSWTQDDDTGKPQKLFIEFRDTGPGIPPQAIKNIFNPFFTTKETGKGTGLGLSLAFSTIEKHKGKITASNYAHGRGAVFLIELPVLAAKKDA
ncbi:MAG TPA: CHASE domain-containing protein [Candidatus Omnitrophota bacterium]|nr:CHASE domain-containing protein [Candidatus Omnitrophota bacterium]